MLIIRKQLVLPWLPLLLIFVAISKVKSRIEITFENENLTSVPQNLPIQINVLRLSNNEISKIKGDEFEKYPNILHLYLDGNIIETSVDIPGITKLENLIYLDLSRNGLITLNLEFLQFGFKPVKLEILILNDNPNITIDMNTPPLSSLVQFSVANCKLNAIPSLDFTEFDNLKILDFQGNNISNITDVEAIPDSIELNIDKDLYENLKTRSDIREKNITLLCNFSICEDHTQINKNDQENITYKYGQVTYEDGQGCCVALYIVGGILMLPLLITVIALVVVYCKYRKSIFNNLRQLFNQSNQIEQNDPNSHEIIPLTRRHPRNDTSNQNTEL